MLDRPKQKTARRHGAICAFFFALGLAACFLSPRLCRRSDEGAPAASPPAARRMKSMVLEDETGRKKAILKLDPAACDAGVYGKNGEYRAALNAFSTLELFDEKNRTCAALNISAGAPALLIYNEAGEIAVRLAAAPPGPALMLADPAGEMRIAAGVLSGRPRLDIADADGAQRVSLTMTKDGPALTLLDERGAIAAVLGIDRRPDEKPILTLFNSDGEPVWRSDQPKK